MKRCLGVAGLALAMAGAAAAQNAAQRPVGATLDPEILAVLGASGLIGPALHGESRATALEQLPDAQAAQSGFADSFAAKSGATLDSLECGDEGCDAVISLGGSDPATIVERIAAVEAWLADASACGYSLSMPGVGDPTGRMRAEVRCTD